MHTIIVALATLLAVVIGLLQWEMCLGETPLLGWSGLYIHCLLVGTLCCLVHWLARSSLRPIDTVSTGKVMRQTHGSMHE